MGETDEHRDEMVRHIELLRHYFAGQNVYVSGNLLVYYEEGNPKKFVVPDCFVVKGADPRKRRIYKIWVEPSAPHVVIETTSKKTRKKDTQEKPLLYAQLGIREYFLFDPDQEYLEPPLHGYRLSGTGYVPMEPDEDRGLISQELGLRLRPGKGELEFYRMTTGEKLLSAEERVAEALRAPRLSEETRVREAEARMREAEARVREAEAHRAAEAEARRAAEAEVERLRNELDRHRHE